MRRPNRFSLAAGLFAVGAGLFLAGLGAGQDSLPAGDLEKLVTHDAKAIQAVLAKGKLDKKAANKIKAAAALIGLYGHAYSGKDKAASMATVRDLAGKLAKAADEGKLDEVKKLAGMLSPTVAPDPASKPGGVYAPDKIVGLDMVMRVFSSERVGGFALEKAIEDLVESKGALEGDARESVEMLGNKVAMVGVLAQAFPPEKDEGKKTKKAWSELAQQMHVAAKALASAAKDKKDGEIGKLATALSDSCVKCHDIFR